MENGIRIVKSRSFSHIIFWLVFILVNGFVWGYCGKINSEYFLLAYTATIALTPILIGGVYTNLYILLPRLFMKRHYIQYIILLAALSFVLGLIVRAVLYYGLGNVFGLDGKPVSFSDPYYIGKSMLLNIGPVMLISTIIKICHLWYQQQNKAQELQREKLDAELKFLRSQIQPHFLFNTLNNLYSLSLQKSNKAPEMILKLSDLMSYMLYETQEGKISLAKEIKHIQNYIDLERLRYGNRLDLQFDVVGSAHGKYVAPLVLIPFVENAFKHGASQDIEKAWIKIVLTITDDTLWIKVENSQGAGESQPAISKGIGLKNVQRRLSLQYANHFELKTGKEEDKYAVDLKLSFL